MRWLLLVAALVAARVAWWVYRTGPSGDSREDVADRGD